MTGDGGEVRIDSGDPWELLKVRIDSDLYEPWELLAAAVRDPAGPQPVTVYGVQYVPTGERAERLFDAVERAEARAGNNPPVYDLPPTAVRLLQEHKTGGLGEMDLESYVRRIVGQAFAAGRDWRPTLPVPETPVLDVEADDPSAAAAVYAAEVAVWADAVAEAAAFERVDEFFACPVPLVSPTGVKVTTDGVQAVWDAFVGPPEDRKVQSIEDRTLMAILRAVSIGLRAHEAPMRGEG